MKISIHLLFKSLTKLRLWLLFTITFVCLASCKKDTETQLRVPGKAKLVAYRVSKHSHLWFQNVETSKIYNIGSVGGRREPTLSLGETIDVEYEGDKIIFNTNSCVRVPANRTTRFVCLPGYDHLKP